MLHYTDGFEGAYGSVTVLCKLSIQLLHTRFTEEEKKYQQKLESKLQADLGANYVWDPEKRDICTGCIEYHF